MYMLMDRLASVGKFMKITEAEMHDENFFERYIGTQIQHAGLP